MDIYSIKIHGCLKYFGRNNDVWYIPESTKKGFVWTETLITNDRVKRAKRVSLQELLLDLSRYKINEKFGITGV